jgi:23S rRNA (adenine2503-C2)-methyltransferase
MEWIWKKSASGFDQMSNLSVSTRELLSSHYKLETIRLADEQTSSDRTIKCAFEVEPGKVVEGVLIPTASRMTACISSQVGCSLSCAFCGTGRLKMLRNLTAGEIYDQVVFLKRMAEERYNIPLSNIVYMGMGEPLQNYTALLPALRIMLSDHAYGLSRRRVTVSTSGMVPMIDRLREDCPVALAVSLHAPTNSLRDDLVPLNKKYPLDELMAACLHYLDKAPRDFVTFEYCMLAGVNDSVEQAHELVRLVRHRVPCKFNLIPFNPFPQSGLQGSPRPVVQAFAAVLQEAGMVTTVRKTRGDDIDAACGQLAGEVQDRTSVKQRISLRIAAQKVQPGIAMLAATVQKDQDL